MKKPTQELIRIRALIFLSIVAVGSFAQYAWGLTLCGVFGYSYPFTSPLFLPSDRFMDFFNINYISGAGGLHAYSPFSYLVSKGFAQMGDYSKGAQWARMQWSGILSLSVMVGLAIVFVARLAQRITSQLSDKSLDRTRSFFLICVIVVTSYPFVFAVDRGNYVLLAFVFFYLFVSSLYRQEQPASSNAAFDFRSRGWTCLFLAMTVSMKTYLCLLLIPFLADRDYKTVLLTCFFIGLLNGLSALLLVNDSISIWEAIFSFGKFTDMYRSRCFAEKMGWSLHLINVFYFPLALAYTCGVVGDLGRAANILETLYFSLVFLPGIVVLPWLIVKTVPDLIGRLFYITLVALFLPMGATPSYTLIFIFLFAPYLLERPDTLSGTIDCVLVAWIMVPKHYFTFFVENDMRVTFQGIATPLAILMIILLLLWRTSNRHLGRGNTDHQRLDRSSPDEHSSNPTRPPDDYPRGALKNNIGAHDLGGALTE